MLQGESLGVGIALNVEVHGDPAVGMAEHFLCHFQVHLFCLEQSGKRAPEGMPADLLAVHTSTFGLRGGVAVPGPNQASRASARLFRVKRRPSPCPLGTGILCTECIAALRVKDESGLRRDSLQS